MIPSIILLTILSIVTLNASYYNIFKNKNVSSVAHQQYLISSFYTPHKTKCLSQCNLFNSCLCLAYNTEKTSQQMENCFLYSWYFIDSELTISTETNLYRKKTTNDQSCNQLVTINTIDCVNTSKFLLYLLYNYKIFKLTF